MSQTYARFTVCAAAYPPCWLLLWFLKKYLRTHSHFPFYQSLVWIGHEASYHVIAVANRSHDCVVVTRSRDRCSYPITWLLHSYSITWLLYCFPFAWFLHHNRSRVLGCDRPRSRRQPPWSRGTESRGHAYFSRDGTWREKTWASDRGLQQVRSTKQVLVFLDFYTNRKLYWWWLGL